MNRALITGSNGYIGKFLTNILIERGWKVIQFDSAKNPLQDVSFTTLERIFETQIFDFVFHLAAVSRVGLCDQDLQKTYAVNSLSTIRLHRLCQRFNRRLVFISSKAVAATEKTAYSMSKGLAEFHLAGQSNCVIVRLPNVIGGYPGFSFKDYFSLFENIVLKLKTNKPLTIFGNAKREYASIQNVVYEILEAAIGPDSITVNVDGSMFCSSHQLVEAMETVTGKKIDYEIGGIIDPQNYTAREGSLINLDKLHEIYKSYK